MSLLKEALSVERDLKEVKIDTYDVETFFSLEKDIMNIEELLTKNKEEFTASLESLDTSILRSITMPKDMSFESTDEEYLKGLLKVTLEKKISMYESLKIKLKSFFKGLKHVFMGYNSIINDLMKIQYVDVDETERVSKLFTKKFSTYLAKGDKTPSKIIDSLMQNKASDLYNQHFDFLHFLYSNLYAETKFEDLPEIVKKEASKIKSYKELVKPLLTSNSLHKETKHIKEYRKDMLDGSLVTAVLNPYGSITTLISFGDHSVNSLYNKMTGGKTLVDFSQIRIDDKSLECKVDKISAKQIQDFLKYLKQEVFDLEKMYQKQLPTMMEEKLATKLTTKSSVIFEYRKALFTSSLHLHTTTKLHIDIVKAFIRDAAIEGVKDD